MSIWLHPRNKALDRFTIGTACWGYILDHAGLIWPFQTEKARWFVTSGIDPRFEADGDGSLYPNILGDSGRRFRVMADEAHHLARVARNMVAIQAVLNTGNVQTPDFREPWPMKVRDDWPPIWAAFAEWADQSRGFVKGG